MKRGFIAAGALGLALAQSALAIDPICRSSFEFTSNNHPLKMAVQGNTGGTDFWGVFFGRAGNGEPPTRFSGTCTPLKMEFIRTAADGGWTQVYNGTRALVADGSLVLYMGTFEHFEHGRSLGKFPWKARRMGNLEDDVVLNPVNE